jgi:hypothetical protein
VRPYLTWSQVAAYFDGDDNFSITDLSNRPFKLGLQVVFTDQSSEQVSMLRDFFLRRGIRLSNVLKTSKGTASMIAIGNYEGVLIASKAMEPYLFRKANEAAAVIDYYEGRITGNELVSIFQREVEAGRRERRRHTVRVEVPYTFPQGDPMMKFRRRRRIGDSINQNRARLTRQDYERIRRDHFERGLSLAKLTTTYRMYSRETIRRVLGGGRGYVLVKGVGRVNTTSQ